MMASMRLLILFLCIAWGCEKSTTPSYKEVFAYGRGEDSSPVYRLFIPQDWETLPLSEQGKVDSREPNLTLLAPIGDKKLPIYFHNFPVANLNERIPPEAQVQRWKEQIPKIVFEKTEPVSRGGFFGLYAQIEGAKEERAIKTLAVAMQLDPTFARDLSQRHETLIDANALAQTLADYTLKCMGSEEEIEKIKEAFEKIAASIELIEELPGDI